MMPLLWYAEVAVAGVLFAAGKYWFVFRGRPLFGVSLIAAALLCLAQACPRLIDWWTA